MILKKSAFILFLVQFIFILLTSGCVTQPEEPKETILVNINKQTTISLNEFLRRAEYSIRPPFAKGNSYIHKKIILNALIAEKLFALEEGDSSRLFQSEEFLAFIRGRKEQAMRQWMHNVEATAKVKPDEADIKKYFITAGRKYEIAYFAVSDKSLFHDATTLLKQGQPFEDVYFKIYGDTILPKRTVDWSAAEQIKILDALFAKNIQPGQVLEPVIIDQNDYLFMKVLKWTDEKVLTEKQVQKRTEDIRETLIRIQASVIWNRVVSEIMQGKTLSFNEDVFRKLSAIFFEEYFRDDEQKRDQLTRTFWDIENMKVLNPEDLDTREILGQTFFTIDGKSWTVEEFRKVLMSHPLVFRKKQLPSNEFAQQFRLAVADLIRDIYVTRVAYEKKYDEVNIVKRNESMWRDAILSRYHKNNLLLKVPQTANDVKRSPDAIGQFLNARVDSLQKKYKNKIELNIEAFEKIYLSSIDLYVEYNKQPYQSVVPNFPILTTESRIDYIKSMPGTSGNN